MFSDLFQNLEQQFRTRLDWHWPEEDVDPADVALPVADASFPAKFQIVWEQARFRNRIVD
jgi:hypothetical protein